MSNPVILTCPSCRGKFNGKNVTHSHAGADTIDERFLECKRCHGQGAVTCETCGGNGRVVMEDGKIINTHSRPATSAVLGPRPPKGGHP